MNIDDDLDPTLLSPELDEIVRRELASGEKVAWLGRPIPRRMAAGVVPISIFGLFFAGFAVFWMATAAGITAGAKKPGNVFFALFGLPFFLIGLSAILSPYWAYRLAQRTVYVLTNRRAIVFEAGFKGRLKVQSYEADRLGSTYRDERFDGSGDLVFEEVISRGRKGGRVVTRRGFLAIENVHQVHALLRVHVLKEG